MRVGSLFSGYGGLDLGLRSVLGGTVAWHSDIDAGPCALLAHRYPDVPNLGDIAAIDFRDVEPVDLLTGGFPCQDVSAAGRRAGLGPGTRTGLWAHMHRAIQTMRPALVVAENVRGLLSAEAHTARDVEPDPWDLGDRRGRPALRALGAVLGDLAGIGYDARWYGLRAADAGAPHGRFRVFVFAWPAADADGVGARPESRGGECATESTAQQHIGGRQPGAGPLHRGGVAADAEGDRRQRGGRPRGRRPGPAHHGLPAAAHAADPDGPGLEGRDPGERPDERALGPHGLGAGPVTWGAYGPAVARWEAVTGRPAPAPTEPGRAGAPRLAPAFVEWMMGLPAGHVTDVPGLTRAEQIRLLGNGVVPQQAALAARHFLAEQAQEVAA